MWRRRGGKARKGLVTEQGASVGSWASLLPRISGEPPRAHPRVVRKLGFYYLMD